MAILLQLLTIALSAIGVVVLVLGLSNNVLSRLIRQRLAVLILKRTKSASTTPGQADTRRVSNMLDVLSRLSLPQAGWKDSDVQLRFVRAGLRHPNAPRIYFACKTGLTLAALLVAFMLMPLIEPDASWAQWLSTMLSAALMASFLPDLYLRTRTTARTQRMQNTLPDVIDLLVICTESGLGLDAAIGKVAHEMARSSPDLAEEFYIMGLEIRAGAARMDALRNLATRANLEELHDLVSMLIQADRFGTSLAVSLRIQSDVMRGKRMQRAEEIAAKIPTKMLLPLILFIFPVLLMVLIGPAVIQMSKAFTS
jgi:tight adherence protein C